MSVSIVHKRSPVLSTVRHAPAPIVQSRLQKDGGIGPDVHEQDVFVVMRVAPLGAPVTTVRPFWHRATSLVVVTEVVTLDVSVVVVGVVDADVVSEVVGDEV